jgi:amino acid adenylation domain-containing protein
VSPPRHDFPLSPLTEGDLEAVATRLTARTGDADLIEDVYPLSPLQEAMFFHTIASEVEDLYVIQQRLVIDGPLDLALFEEGWSRIIARHAALRTVFSWEQQGKPAQVVCRHVTVPIELVDLTDATEPDARIEDRIEAERRRGFTLDAPPLMRLVLFRLAPDRHELLWSQHHLLEDGWSATNVLREVFDTYEALATGQQVELPPVRPYGDYIRWLAARDPAETESFWRKQLEGFAEPTRLVEGSRNGVERRYVWLYRSLGAELSTAVRTFARDHRLTLNTVLAGAMAIVLGRYVGRSDIAFGVVSSGRPYSLAGVESMVGMFINTLLLRVEIDEDLPLPDWLRRIQARQAALLEHEHAPLTLIQEWSDLGRGTTLTDTLFAFWGFGGEDTSAERTLRYRTVAGYGRTSFPVSVTIEAGDVLRVELDFDAADLDDATGKRLVGHYATVLEAMVAASEAPVGTIEMLTSDERATLRDFNATTVERTHETVIAAFKAQVAERPDTVAVACGDDTTSYAELDRHSDDLAARIMAVRNTDELRVVVYLPRSTDLMVAVLGVLKAGAAYVPIDRHYPRERVALLLEDSGAEIVVTSQALASQIPEGRAQVVTLPLAATPNLEPFADPAIRPDNAAYVIYTSGSTGRPKGVVVTHDNLANYILWAQQQYGGDRPVSFPLYSSVAFDLTVTSMFVPLVSGGTVVVYPDADVRDLSIIDVFEDDVVDVVKLTPSHLAVLEPDHLATKRIRALILGGEELKTDLARAAVEASGGGVTVFNEYGPTEATVGCMIHRYEPETDTDVAVPIGTPAANTQIHVLDRNLEPVPPGVTGEIYVAGAGVSRGYLGAPDLTDAAFLPNPLMPGSRMYRTGDHARWRPDGVVEYLGRTDDQVKVRGYRIEPGEVEAALAAHPTVSGAAVAVREPHPGDLRLVGYYVAAADAAPNVTVLRDFLRERLPDYMVPQHMVRVDALPLTSNGKLDRNALPDTIGEVTRSHAPVEPRSDAERLVAKLSAELLGVDRVSMRDNFFDLGGHSVLAMQLIARIHAETGVRLSPRVVLLNTLEQAAAQLPGAAVEPASQAPRVDAVEPVDAVGTSAFFFGPSEEPLFGIHSAPAGGEPRSTAVVLCPPIGWEYMRTHWAVRKLARMLVRTGYHVLRFDYFGTGDSAGSTRDGSVRRWIDDVATAAEELRIVAGVAGISAVGIRHGATFAAVATRAGLELDRLVMWDPVVSGAGYLAALDAMQAEMLATRRGGPPTGDVLGDELLGFPYPDSLRRELAALDPGSVPWPETVVHLMTSQDRPEYRALATAADGALEYEVVEDVGEWDELASSYSSLLPQRIPARIAALFGGDE